MSTVQDLFLAFYPKYKEQYNPSFEQAKASKAMMNCRTAALGGNAYGC